MSGYSITSGGGHLDDAIIMQLLDREPGSPAGAPEHLESCAACADRMGVLRRAAEALSAGLPDVAMPPLSLVAPRRRAWLLSFPMVAAASLVVLASAAAATPPVREWVLRQFAPDAPVTPPPTTTPATTPATSGAGIVASFAPTDTMFVIRVDRRQAVGAVELSVTAGDRISAQAFGGTAAEELVVLPGQLRVVNTAASVADYRVQVPASVRIVRVFIGDREVAVVRVSADLHRRLDLR
jgi:hypothetical protein